MYLSLSHGFSQLQFIDITTRYTINRLSLYRSIVLLRVFISEAWFWRHFFSGF
jgi:hypothetical protein